MKTHRSIEIRSLAMAKAMWIRSTGILKKRGLSKARATCAKWMRQNPAPAVREWMELLQRPWPTIRAILLDPSEEGRRLRQSDPFCGILSPRERWNVYREFRRCEA